MNVRQDDRQPLLAAIARFGAFVWRARMPRAMGDVIYA